MTDSATVTSKGRITVPKRIRELLRMAVGDRVHFVVDEVGSVRLEVRRRDAIELAGMLARKDIDRLSVEQMDAAVQRRFGAHR